MKQRRGEGEQELWEAGRELSSIGTALGAVEGM